MASVILHFTFPGRYPILDKRVMRVAGGPDAYNFDAWVEYTGWAICATCNLPPRRLPAPGPRAVLSTGDLGVVAGSAVGPC